MAPRFKSLQYEQALSFSITSRMGGPLGGNVVKSLEPMDGLSHISYVSYMGNDAYNLEYKRQAGGVTVYRYQYCTASYRIDHLSGINQCTASNQTKKKVFWTHAWRVGAIRDSRELQLSAFVTNPPIANGSYLTKDHGTTTGGQGRQPPHMFGW